MSIPHHRNRSYSPSIASLRNPSVPFVSLGLNDGQTLQHFLLIAKKYIWLVLVCALLGTGAGFIENATSPKEYRSSANIEITQDTADQFRMDTGGGYDSGYIDVAKLDTEIAILKSSTLAMATIESLHLDQNKDFLPPGSNYIFDLIQDTGPSRLDRDL